MHPFTSLSTPSLDTFPVTATFPTSAGNSVQMPQKAIHAMLGLPV
jgi:hypothetical protein